MLASIIVGAWGGYYSRDVTVGQGRPSLFDGFSKRLFHLIRPSSRIPQGFAQEKHIVIEQGSQVIITIKSLFIIQLDQYANIPISLLQSGGYLCSSSGNRIKLVP